MQTITEKAINHAITELNNGSRSARFRESDHDYSLRETALDFWTLQEYNNRCPHVVAYINHYGDQFQVNQEVS